MTSTRPFDRRTTGIGSVPFTDADDSARFILESGLDIPFWPQLPKRSFRELMNPQFTEGMPCLAVDAGRKRVWFEIDDDKPERMTAFYENVLAGDYGELELSREAAAGYHAFLAELKNRELHFDWLKGQITGPLTFTLSVQDQNRRPVFYDPDLQEASVRALAVKGGQQVEALSPFADGVIIFIDEPVLAAFGTSAYLSLTADDVIRLIDEVAAPLKDAGAVVAVHCCGNTDWAMMTQTKVDILSFDAYGYAESVGLYPKEVKGFLERGGTLAWGIVPTSDAVRSESAEGLTRRLDEQMREVARRGIDLEQLRAQALITPSCGTGSMEEDDARRVFEMLTDIGKMFRDR